jgi:hypothetical protein
MLLLVCLQDGLAVAMPLGKFCPSQSLSTGRLVPVFFTPIHNFFGCCLEGILEKVSLGGDVGPKGLSLSRLIKGTHFLTDVASIQPTMQISTLLKLRPMLDREIADALS